MNTKGAIGRQTGPTTTPTAILALTPADERLNGGQREASPPTRDWGVTPTSLHPNVPRKNKRPLMSEKGISSAPLWEDGPGAVVGLGL